MQVIPILINDGTQKVQHQPALSADGLERSNAGRHAVKAGLLGCPVRYDGDVGVHDHVSPHAELSCRRCSAARLIAAISPNSSPKKPSGQFLMFP